MMWRKASLGTLRKSWGPAREYDATLTNGEQIRALVYVPQVGEAEPGDAVLVSYAALARGLGTGGYAIVIANLDRLPADPPPSPGHLMKARYTPAQFMVLGADDPESPHHELLQDADSITDMPVVVADLHSALPAIVAAIRADQPHARIAYVMDDGGALPAWFSQVAYQLTSAGDILGTITCGQAYGGALEAVNVHTALLAARLVWQADVAIVAQGPGNLGTGTRWGFSGVSVATALEAAAVLGGQPIACVRMSNADTRPRHYGISHHTLRVLQDAVHTPGVVPLPTNSATELLCQQIPASAWEKVAEQATQLPEHLTQVAVDSRGLTSILENSTAPLRTMGRGLTEDPLAFLAAGAAGRYCASLL
ncbi:MAG: DUF3866 family protein [Trueperella sp.]|nr:DUF3866 family protein [Trueperella sp.]